MSYRTGDRLCVIQGCHALGEHLDDCRSDRCKGCRPRYVESGFVCNSDRTGLASTLDDIRDLDGQLREEPDPIDHAADDPLNRILPMGIVSSLGAGARVSGSKEQSAPTSLDRLDLASAARVANLTPAGRAAEDDQIGHSPAAAVLDREVRDWREQLFPGHHLPVATVPELVGWLLVRLQDACDKHLGIDEFAEVIRELRRALRAELGLNAPPREHCHGVFCKACDLKSLFREGGLISCRNCGENYDENAYHRWVGLLNARTIQRLREGDLEMPDSREVRRLVA
jgi:hypothetical protein